MGSNIPLSFFFFNDTATTEIYTLSLHDALPISLDCLRRHGAKDKSIAVAYCPGAFEIPQIAQKFASAGKVDRSEEHTSELQSRPHLVCRLLLEKKNYWERNLDLIFVTINPME